MRSHLIGLPGGLLTAPTLDPDYWRHPVHGAKALADKARESVAQAFDGDPHGPRWALTVLACALDGNVKAIAQHGDALEILAAHFSTPAPTDNCAPHGITRPSA